VQLFVYCAGGFGQEVTDIARRVNASGARWAAIGFLDDSSSAREVYGAPVLRLDAALEQFGAPNLEVAIANGEPFVRMALRQKLEAAGVRLATLVDPSAVVSPSARLHPGAVVFPGCFVSSGAELGVNSVMIAGALLGHHAVVGEDCMIAGQVNVGGACRIGNRSYVGMGAQLREQTKVGTASIVGMGSIVFADLPDEVVALGNPCRPMRPNTSKRVFG
jgi:sugar O-acyltransferase (sialic acid O-acetyltransferase NeuD family)